jgi:two-component system chemotaxis response regulator CheY
MEDTTQRASGSERSVLIVEDNLALRESLSGLLAAQNIAVESASDGLDALERLECGFRPCLILLDLQMPGVDGKAFLRARRLDAEIRAIPVVAVSSHQLGFDMRQFNVVGVLTKPVDAKLLLRIVEDYVRFH